MNRYAKRLEQHFREQRPTEVRQLEDPEGHFETLGLEVELVVDERADLIAGPSRPEETFLERMGRLGEARLTAESEVLATVLQQELPN